MLNVKFLDKNDLPVTYKNTSLNKENTIKTLSKCSINGSSAKSLKSYGKIISEIEKCRLENDAAAK